MTRDLDVMLAPGVLPLDARKPVEEVAVPHAIAPAFEQFREIESESRDPLPKELSYP